MFLILLFYMLLYECYGILPDYYQADTASASNNIKAHDSAGFFVFTAFTTINSTINYRPGWRLPPSRQRRLSAFCETDLAVVEKVIKTHPEPPELSHHPGQRRIDELVVRGM